MVTSHPHEFETSMVEAKDLRTLVIVGLLQKNIIQREKILGKESYPMLEADQIVVFTHHLMHGFRMHVYRFFYDLHYYHIKLVNLNPNSILHMPFSHLCEAYHGITPFFTLS
jgi:hypothetical protein